MPMFMVFPDNSSGKEDLPGPGRSLGGGNGNPLQYFCWENPMDRGAWLATVHRVTKELDMTAFKHTCMHAHQYSHYYHTGLVI